MAACLCQDQTAANAFEPLSPARPKDKQDWEQTQRTKEDKGQRRAQIGQRTSKTGSTKAAQSQDEVDQEEGWAKEMRANTMQFRTNLQRQRQGQTNYDEKGHRMDYAD